MMEIISSVSGAGEGGAEARGGVRDGVRDGVCDGVCDGVMRITEVKPAVRDKSRVNVFVDGKFRFSLTLAQVVDLGVRVGQEVTEEDLASYQAEADFGKLYQRALEYALTRPHSVKEMRDYLKRKQRKRMIDRRRYEEHVRKMKEESEYREKVKEIRARVREKNEKIRSFEEDNRFEYSGRARTGLPVKPGAEILDRDIERVVAKLVEERAVGDAEFTRYFLENRNAAKGTSLRKLKLELRAKGISDEMIAEALEPDEYGEVVRDEKQEILKVIEKKRARGMTDEKLTAYLLRQGFPYDLVKDSLREMDSQN